jgi:hypothetical protein
MMHTLRGSYASHELDVRSKALLHEMSNVIVDGGHIGAPESGAGGDKDDRVFAMGLAVRAWKDWTQKEMLSQGLTMEVCLAKDRGEAPAHATRVNAIVANFFKMAEEKANESAPPTWREQMGLL